MLPLVVLIPFGLGASVLGGIQYVRHRKRQAIERRSSLGDDAIYLMFYADSGISKSDVLEIWNEIATTLGVPQEKLRPSDRFGAEIGWYLITSEELDDLHDRARLRARKLGLKIDLFTIKTVDEYVRTFVKRQ